MTRTRDYRMLALAATALVIVAWSAHFVSTLAAQGRGGGKTPPPAGAATLRDGASDAIVSDGATYAGTFVDGRFTFQAGAGRTVCFTFGTDLGVLTPPPISDPTLPSSGCYFAVTFTMLGEGIFGIAQGATEIRSLRFAWPGADKNASSYGVHFRGDAILDGETEMSRVRVTCDASLAGQCTSWTLTPCESLTDAPCQPDDVPVDGAGNPIDAPVGQVYATFPRGQGTWHIARYVMPWGMTIQRQ